MQGDMHGDTVQDRIDRWMSRIHPDDFPYIEARWFACTTNGTDYEAEFRVRDHDGTYCWGRSQAWPRKADDGSVLQWHGYFCNITEVRQLQDRVKELEAELTLGSSRLCLERLP